ncbi:tellurite resistance TerB family protein, partial [Xylella fastidiosa subsp. multiplex]|nr:tellurite resistance TerB family protein [Xylella fastidiosa subsp. multiplex]
VVDEESYMERAYLDELARRLQLQPGLKEQLEQHARAAVA